MITNQVIVIPKRVLVIDDEADMREIAQASLEIMAGLEVITAQSSQEGLLKAELEQPDAILLDLMLPGMDGFSVVRRLQTNPLTKTIPVVLLTAKAQLLNPNEWIGSAIKGTIAKPFKPAKLAQRLIEILGWCADAEPTSFS